MKRCWVNDNDGNQIDLIRDAGPVSPFQNTVRILNPLCDTFYPGAQNLGKSN